MADNNVLSFPHSQDTIQSLWRLEKIILDSLNFSEVVQKIVDSVLLELGVLNLGYRIVVLALVDKKDGILKRVSVSQTEEAKIALANLSIPFSKIDIPLEATNNYCIKAFNTKEPQITHDWVDVLTPPLDADQVRKAQTAAEIKTSLIYPVISRGEALGIIIFSLTKAEEEISLPEKDLIRSYTDVVGLAVQNSQLYSNLESLTMQISEANQRLRELDKLKSEFVSVASHELRTPMTSIKSYLWMALDGRGGELSEKQKYYLDRAYSSTDRLIKLVNDLLNVSRIESGRLLLSFEKVSLEKLINDVIAEIKPRIDELKITVTVDQDKKKTIPEVLADSDKIKEVVVNLIGNSLKFTQPGGQIRIWFEINNGLVITHVIDNGIGIEPSELPKLFQKFGLIPGSYTTNQQVSQGTGLGLYISKSIIEMHGGKMWAGSEGKNKGATFSFSLKIFNQEEFEKWQKENQNKEGLGIIHSGL